jgi:DNA-binding protein HU-beta
MNKSELIDAIVKETKCTKVCANATIDAIIKVVTNTLKKGDDVVLVGFGTFKTAKRAARTGRNPQTGKALKIAAKRVPKFKAGAALKKAVK